MVMVQMSDSGAKEEEIDAWGFAGQPTLLSNLQARA